MNEVYKMKETGSGAEKAIEKDDSFNPEDNENFSKESRKIECLQVLNLTHVGFVVEIKYIYFVIVIIIFVMPFVFVLITTGSTFFRYFL